MSINESGYPVSFRSEDATSLGQHLRHHESVVLIGMKRVGISNFLRFFLYHNDIEETYIKNGTRHLFIPVDLNNLVEREITPFWTLVLKRVADTIEQSDFPKTVKDKASKAFNESIQLQDPFVTLDSVQKVMADIVSHDYYPTIFLLRFDRLKDAATPAFFDNLQSVKDAARRQMSYVFTSYRPLNELCPDVFTKASLSVFSKDMYLKPANDDDMRTILNTLQSRYGKPLDAKQQQSLLDFAGGHVQYLHAGITRLQEVPPDVHLSREELFVELLRDEQVQLQSEELFDSLMPAEQDVLYKLREGKTPTETETTAASYLWETGMLTGSKKVSAIFSPLLADYVHKVSAAKSKKNDDFTKKENLLFTFLKKHFEELVERDAIIEAVWPDQQELGVSDWAIDRLIARVRAKLKSQNSEFEIQTVVTRGYKLIKK